MVAAVISSYFLLRLVAALVRPDLRLCRASFVFLQTFHFIRLEVMLTL